MEFVYGVAVSRVSVLYFKQDCGKRRTECIDVVLECMPIEEGHLWPLE